MHRIFRGGIVAAFLVAAITASTVPCSAQQVVAHRESVAQQRVTDPSAQLPPLPRRVP